MDKNILAIVMGVIAIAIAFVIFPIVLDGAATILADANLADYTGLEAIVQVAPLIVFVAMLLAAGSWHSRAFLVIANLSPKGKREGAWHYSAKNAYKTYSY